MLPTAKVIDMFIDDDGLQARLDAPYLADMRRLSSKIRDALPAHLRPDLPELEDMYSAFRMDCIEAALEFGR